MQNSGEASRGLKKGDDCAKLLLAWKGDIEGNCNKEDFERDPPRQGKAKL